MKNLNKISLSLTIFTTLLYSSSSWAQDKSPLKISPIVGLERIQKVSPVQKSKTRTIVGLNILYGPSFLSAEAEVTRSEDSETLYEEDLTEKEESYAAKLGLRSSFNMAYLNWFLRAGAQARKSKYTTTRSGVTTEREPAVYVSPYAGTGFNFNLMGNLFANGGITVIFTGRPKGSDREYQTTLGFGVRI
ncbi:MAG: hypothetical protein CME63_03090 [Halobacteriovoraceae bacterium]|nr:hypothetical protein [Halobacteriovoraceae bacterium]|tara:strand:+ start:9252 stop:9821 length:570 start_codon:yes stop_codon:yes gene_type:complete